MGLRRLSKKEEGACRTMAQVRLDAGQKRSKIVSHLVRYLQTAGWLPGPARRRASLLVTELKAEAGQAPFNVHPADRPLYREMEALAFAAANAFDLPLKVFEAKRRPHPNGADGLCYVAEGRIAIVFRHREAGQWWRHPHPRGVVLKTVAHELAHLRHKRHGAEHFALEEEIQAWLEERIRGAG